MVSSKKSRTLFLLFVPIVIAEFLTGSTPLPALLSPLTLPTLLGLYCAEALLVREVTVVWKKGWPTILALGCAYGVVEEGVDVKSWFNPHWGALGILGTYGRVFGINWVWAVELTLFHSIFSIAIPILLATLLFPASAGQDGSLVGGCRSSSSSSSPTSSSASPSSPTLLRPSSTWWPRRRS